MPQFPALAGDIETDVAIVGGGLAGLLCAAFLREAGLETVVLEADRIGSGTTGGTTAVLTAQHDVLYQDLEKRAGFDGARAYLNANLWALERFAALAQHIDCDFETCDSVMYDANDAAKLQREVGVLKRLGYSAAFSTETELPFDVAGTLRYPDMAQFHPLKFLAGLAQGHTIFEQTRVTKIEGNTLFTDRGNVSAKRIIVATRFPILNKHGWYWLKMYQTRSYILALEGAGRLSASYVDGGKAGFYFRSYGDLLLVGGGDQRVGRKSRGFPYVAAFVQEHYPDADLRYAWAAQDCMSLDQVPYIGRYSPALPHVFVLTGFNEWGMTHAMIGAARLCDMLTGKTPETPKLYNPRRSIFKPQLFANLGATLLNFVKPTAKRCPHLGCGLTWNDRERSWDCPCHGSRFTEDGGLIDGPAFKKMQNAECRVQHE